MPKFLSEEWVIEARAIQAEFTGRTAAPAAEARINLTITAVPVEVGVDPIQANIDTTGGAAELDLGHHDSSDAQISLEYETAKAFLVEGNPQVVMQAVMSGKVKISGDMTKVLALQGGV
ncbi:MAG: SCP2 sterol-binding domain-containing protein, partial [Acidimicrobiales bacterium]|nr:SCP2 sterol-binding domain-containing protein [Acidimicrobiales bacterium]